MRKRTLLAVLILALNSLMASAGHGDEDLPGIVFVADDIFGPKFEWPGNARPGTNHWRDGYLYHRATTQHPLERTTTPTRPGSNLYTLVPARPDGTVTRITHLTNGGVFDPEPSYDGRRILFSMRRDGEDWFNLYEIGADGSKLVQLTDGPFNDVSGVYLPDGQIVFVSDRAGYLEEYHEERTEALWIMQGDGSGIRQLTFNPGTVFDPSVMSDGRILFSLWDTFMLNIPPADKHETYLMAIRPDGTEEGHFFGAGQYRFFSRERHSGVAMTQTGQMPDGTILVQTELGPSILDPRQGPTLREALHPIFPGTTSIQLGGATHRVHLSPTGSRSTPYPLSDGRILFSGTLPGAHDIAIYVADPKTRQTRLVFNDPSTSEFDARPILLSRPRPAVLPPKGRGQWGTGSEAHEVDESGPPRLAVTGRARLAVLHARRSDDPEKEKALQRARYLRVIEVLPTAVTSSSHTSLATRILGVVPILADGSVYCEVPSNTALFLEPIDSAGHRLEYTWRHPVTSVPVGSHQMLLEMTYITAQTGEVKSCNGCHAPQEEAASQRGLARALAFSHPPVQTQRDTTDIMYRRNELDEYRCQARIGEASMVRPWLANPDPDLRRRACELLMQMEDEAREDASAIAGLLTDPSVAVRRAAALALTRVGRLEQAPALLQALADPDWQVRFHSATALESVTACRTEFPLSMGAGNHLPATPRIGSAALPSRHEFYQRLVGPRGMAELKTALGQGPEALATLAEQNDPDLARRWYEAVGRLGRDAPESARHHIREALQVPAPPPITFEPMVGKRHGLQSEPPELAAIRAAGWVGDAQNVSLLIPWLSRHEYQDHATEAAVALGRIGTARAVAALWETLRRDVPNKAPFQRRYLQHGPRPEEYALLRGLILAGSAPAIDDVYLLFALLPGTFLEKPRYEDRLRSESQRVLLGRRLLEDAGLRRPAVRRLVSVVRGEAPPANDALYQQILKGINLERPFAEHRRPFPVIERIEAEQALWLLGCLAVDQTEVPEDTVAGYLTSASWRERIDAAVLLNMLGFAAQTAEVLASQVRAPYAFKEIMGIGKSHYDENFRDKCYLAMALAHHAVDVQELREFADPKTYYRDVRYGLATGLGMRETPDGIDLLARIATSDPIAANRRQARLALRRIQEAERLAGRPVTEITMPDAQPFEVWYPPRGLRWPNPLSVPRPSQPDPAAASFEEVRKMVARGLEKERYRDLNNSNNQAPGAKRMMVDGIAEFERAARLLSTKYTQQMNSALEELILSPYPFAHYLALHSAQSDDGALSTELLTQRLESFAKSADTVGFFWICDLLAERSAEEAVDQLVRYAELENPSGLHGPAGLGFGYPAAKAVGRLTGSIQSPQVQRLLNSNNDWVRAGVLAGLTDAKAPGTEQLLARLLDTHEPAVIRDHAQVGLRQLKAGERRLETGGRRL